jgi:hypothetical protein
MERQDTKGRIIKETFPSEIVFLGALIGGYFAEVYSATMFYVLGIIILFILIINAIVMKVKYNI